VKAYFNLVKEFITFVKTIIMGLLSKLFSNSDEIISSMNWISLQSKDQLSEIERKSAKNTQVIFKHSTRCGVSKMVLKQFEKQIDLSENKMEFYFLDLLNYREISNEIANKFNVPHQSPQLVVVKNKKVVAQASHHEILDVSLNQFI
jgi:bacillithiol system protein YtxJ